MDGRRKDGCRMVAYSKHTVFACQHESQKECKGQTATRISSAAQSQKGDEEKG